MMFGAHLSIAGGLHHALTAAQGLGMDCVQVFTKNQRQWTPPALTDEMIGLWRKHRSSTGVREVVSHDSYLINLASPDGQMWERAIGLFREELLRCEALGIAWLVTHPGSHMGAGDEAGLRRVAAALDRVHKELPGLKTVTCLEITAGQGTSLGCRAEHLREIRGMTREPERLGYCLDTAHLLAAGYDLTSAAGGRAVAEEMDRVLGLREVRVLHVNDSKTPRGSRVDRHEHIGQGHVSVEALRAMLKKREFAGVPKILETPKGEGPGGQDWDSINLKKLKDLLNGNRNGVRCDGRRTGGNRTTANAASRKTHR